MYSALLVNHRINKCGVYQYMYRVNELCKQSNDCKFHYCEVESIEELFQNIENYNPDVIIYNYFSNDTMPWLYYDVVEYIYKQGYEQAILVHSDYLLNVFQPLIGNIKHKIYLDPTQQEDESTFASCRPLIVYPTDNPPKIITVGSIGFVKESFLRIAKLVNETFDEAEIRFNITYAHFGDKDGVVARQMAQKCKDVITKQNIRVNITHDFMTREQMLEFLAKNSINVFLYGEEPVTKENDPGISSAIDDALSVKVPIAINKSAMFRHINYVNPSIILSENNTLKHIISHGVKPLEPLYDKWNPNNFVAKYNYIVRSIMNGRK